jgi:hypothetical protein
MNTTLFCFRPVVSHRCTAELVALSVAVVCRNKCSGSHKRIAVCSEQDIGTACGRRPCAEEWVILHCIAGRLASGLRVGGGGGRGCLPNLCVIPQSYHKTLTFEDINPLSPELNSICCLLVLLAHDFLHVSRIRVKSLILSSYIPLDVLFYILSFYIIYCLSYHFTL